jgi:hypothetical protein
LSNSFLGFRFRPATRQRPRETFDSLGFCSETRILDRNLASIGLRSPPGPPARNGRGIRGNGGSSMGAPGIQRGLCPARLCHLEDRAGGFGATDANQRDSNGDQVIRPSGPRFLSSSPGTQNSPAHCYFGWRTPPTPPAPIRCLAPRARVRGFGFEEEGRWWPGLRRHSPN